ncbi:MAG: hypothetical protein NUV77_11015 [Thermoguttaceae bacterium]|jgi:hypothetical protein|nr:hypothetical protein [Thermoguttaceae bacterium]
MARRATEEMSPAGHDSFLDIVTNMVGILIILVMVVGMRIRNAPVEIKLDEAAQAEAAALAQDEATERSMREDVLKTVEETRRLQAETGLRDAQRLVLAREVAQWEDRLAKRRSQLDAEARDAFDLRRAVAAARTTLDELETARVRAEATPDRPEIIKNRPTPLSKPVDGPELHFQLRGGRIALVPVEPLLRLAQEDMRKKLHDFARHPDLSESANVVGPEGGFRFRYAVERFDELVRGPEGTARREGIRMVRWTVMPASSDLGEPVDAALAEGSQFRRALGAHDPSRTTVTLWVYEDSFESFRKVRDELHRLGYLCAGRPLPGGVLISGSIDGTKSAAE